MSSSGVISSLRNAAKGKSKAKHVACEIKLETVTYRGKSEQKNTVFLIENPYKVGWILNQDADICMCCDVGELLISTLI